MPDCGDMPPGDGDVEWRRSESCPQLEKVPVHTRVCEYGLDRLRLSVERSLGGGVRDNPMSKYNYKIIFREARDAEEENMVGTVQNDCTSSLVQRRPTIFV